MATLWVELTISLVTPKKMYFRKTDLSPKKNKITFHKACETTFGARNGRNVSKNLEVKREMPIFATSESTTLPVRTAYQGGTFYL